MTGLDAVRAVADAVLYGGLSALSVPGNLG